MSQQFPHVEMPSGDHPASEPASLDSVEELGPGDIQYLRGSTMQNPDFASLPQQHLNWPESELAPDDLLRSAERSLSEVILGSMPEPQVAIPQGDPLIRTTRTTQIANVPARGPAEQGGLTLDDLGDVELDIAIELGRSELLIEDVLKLREGSVVTLDKLAGDPVDIIANGRLIARGELLVIDGLFGVRLSEVL